MDFGVAHFASSNMTRTGVMIGTPSYMAPEQITGGRVGPQCDIFSVGAVLYELLTGISPFAGGSLQAVMYRVLSEAPQPVTSSAPGLSPRLNEIVARALAKDPADRYATAIEMANDLLAVRASLDQRPPLTCTLSLRATIDSALDERRTQTFRRVRRRRYAFSGAGVGVAVALVLSGWLLARRTTTTSSGAPNPVNASSPTGVVASAPAPTGKEVVRVDSPPKPVEVSRGSQSSGPPPVQARTSSARTVSPAPQLQSQVTRQTVSTGAPASGRSDAPSVTAPPAAPPNPQPVVTGAPPVAAIPNPPPTSNSSVDVTPPQPAATPTTSSATANAAAVGEINGVIDAYARAIESRDMAELRRVYGAITTNQASAFTEFFKSTRTLRASLAVKNTQVDGNKGTAHVAGTYEFTTTGGRTQQQPVAFDADLRREGGSWKLVAVR